MTQDMDVALTPALPESGYYHGNRFARHGDIRVISAFQPIYSIAHRRIVGLEALARGLDAADSLVPPVRLFAQQEPAAVVALDRLCQQVHVDNFRALAPPSAWLFLNVDPATLGQHAYLAFLQDLLATSALPANRIVIEVLESTIDDELALEARIQACKALGFLVAIDDFGAGHSNFERIWRIKPDIVKLDRGMVQRAGEDASARSLIKGITAMLHHCKCIVLAEGVENEAEAMAAMQGGVDLVQGYFFAHPFLLSEAIRSRSGMWSELYLRFDELTQSSAAREQNHLAPYVARFSRCTTGTGRADSLSAVAQQMLGLPETIRLYQLTLDGSQRYGNIDSDTLRLPARDRLRALADAQGASWKRQDYFLNAARNPGVVQLTQPYFSITDGALCVTLSVRTCIDDGEYIVCCDVLWEETVVSPTTPALPLQAP